MSKTSKTGKDFDTKTASKNVLNNERTGLATSIREKLTEYYQALSMPYSFRHFSFIHNDEEKTLTILDNNYDITLMGVASVEEFILLIEAEIQNFITVKEAELQVLKDNLKE